jgi:hypothetical protein
MRTLTIALVSYALTVGAAFAEGGGTTSLDEVIEQLQDNEKLTAEIFAELKAQNLQAENVLCVGFRFGGRWRNIGGGRAVPYECEVGTRKLNIDGTRHVYDDAGAELDVNDEASFERGVEYKQADITWKWQ